MKTLAHDTFENLLISRLNKSLDDYSYKAINAGEWTSDYIEMFLNLYCQCAGIDNLNYILMTDCRMNEAVTLHSDINNKNVANIVHVISVPFLQELFHYTCFRDVSDSVNCRFNLPNIFPLNYNSENTSETIILEDNIAISSSVTEKLIRFYIAADHAAYHYLQFKKHGDADYNHEGILKSCLIKKIKDIKHCHQLISNVPNKHIQPYLEQHDILENEDCSNSEDDEKMVFVNEGD